MKTIIKNWKNFTSEERQAKASIENIKENCKESTSSSKDLLLENIFDDFYLWFSNDGAPEAYRIYDFAESTANYYYLWTKNGPQRKEIIKKYKNSIGKPDEERRYKRLRDWEDNYYRGNAFRHMLASFMIAHRIEYEVEGIRFAGQTKELIDFTKKMIKSKLGVEGAPGEEEIKRDSVVDLYNNEIGFALASRYRNTSPDDMEYRDYANIALQNMNKGNFFLDPRTDKFEGSPDSKLISSSKQSIKYKDLLVLRRSRK